MMNGIDDMMGGCGIMCISMWAIGALVFIALVLLVIWLLRQLKK